MAVEEGSDWEMTNGGGKEEGVPIKQEEPTAHHGITTSSLGALQSDESRILMDIVDRLRSLKNSTMSVITLCLRASRDALNCSVIVCSLQLR